MPGSFVFGLPSDRPEIFEATAAIAQRAELTFAQFVMLTPFPGTVDFIRWEKGTDSARITWSARCARWLAKPCCHLFAARSMPQLKLLTLWL